MSCVKIYKGQDFACGNWAKKYYQQLVLVNKDDVLNYRILLGSVGFAEQGGEMINPFFRHRIIFELKENKTGFLFRGNENGISFSATFSKTTDDNIVQYDHNAQLPILGTSEETKGILKTLDNGNYFAAIQFQDGTVEIYGFDNGLTTDNYTFDPQGNLGGSSIPLKSKDLEDEPPYVFVSENPNDDFNSLFVSSEVIDLGSFNNDFNNDFDIDP